MPEGAPKRRVGRELVSSQTAEASAAELPPVPEFFDGVKFSKVTDRNGEFVRYRSSEMGRKEIRIDPSSASALTTLDSTQEYRVRVISDSDPVNPDAGFYTVELVSDLEHREAQVARAKRLRESAGFKTLAALINEDPDLSAEYRPVVARHKEFRGLHMEPDARHRNFTGMLSALMMSERGKAMLDKVIDRTIAQESDEIKERIRTAGTRPYVPGITVGAGVYGAVLAATRQMYLPEFPDLTIDQDDRVGGQFAQYRSDLFRLNSRRRPEQPDAPHLPGSSQSLNSFGKHSVMQSSDTGHESYPFQSTIADTARVNFFLSGKAMLGSEVRMVRENTEEGSEGKLIIELFDKETQRVYEVATDRVTYSTGLGKEVDRLDPEDVSTRDILESEARKFEQGQDARVLSFTQFAKRLSDPSNPFPLQGMKRLVLSGEGDSANVIAGVLLGYESQVGKSMSQLDHVEEIIWVGQDLPSKEQFLQTVRTRYAQVGLEFPRDRAAGYYSRIKPVRNSRSFRLTRASGGGIRVFLQADGDRGSNRTYSSVDGDYFVYAHGFEDQTNEALAPLDQRASYRDKVTIQDEIDYYARYNNAQPFIITFSPDANIKRMWVKKVSEREAVVDTLYRDGSVDVATLPKAVLANRLYELNIDDIEELVLTESPGDLDVFKGEVEYQNIRGKRRAIARSYETGNGGKVTKVGPAASLELEPSEIEEAPALQSIKENTAAIFRYIDTVVGYAEATAKRERREGVKPSELLADLRESDQSELPESESKKSVRVATSVFETKGMDTLALGESSLDALKIALGDLLSRYKFPEDLDEITLTYARDYSTEKETRCRVLLQPGLPEEYDQLVRDIEKDPLASAVVRKLVDNARSNSTSIVVPIDNGRALGQRVTIEIPRLNKKQEQALEAA